MGKKISTTNNKISREHLLEQIGELQAKLAETEQTLNAIRNGHVDALVVDAEGNTQIYTLEGPDSPYRSIVETMAAGAVTLNGDYTMLYCNAFFSRMTGIPMAQLIGSSFLDLVPEEYRKVFTDFTDLCRVEICTIDLALATSSGKTLYTQLAGGPEFRDRRHTCIVVTDISARKRAEDDLRIAHDELEQRVEGRTRALRQSERRERERAEELAITLDAIPTPVFIVHDPDSHHITGNRQAEDLLRIPSNGELSFSAPPEIRPRHIRAFRDGRELTTDELPAQRAARGEHVRDFEFSLVFDDSTIIHLLGYGTPLLDEQRRPRGAIHTLVDITERKRAVEALRNSEKLYRGIGESIDYGVWVCTPEGSNIYASESFLKMVGLTQEQCSNYGWIDVLHPDDAKRTIAKWKDCVRTGGTWDVEHRFRGADGQWRPVLARGVAVKNDRDEVVYWAGINLDISRIKHAEEEMEKARAFAENRAGELETLMDAIPAVVLIAHDSAGRYITGNLFTHDMLGVPLRGNISKSTPPEEFPATFRIMRNGKDIPVDQLPVQQAARGAEVKDYELDLLLPDGTKHTVRGNATPLRGPNGNIAGAVGAFIDITERKQAEEGLDAESHALEEVNTALRVLLKQRESDKSDLETNILTNVGQLVLPHIAKLKKTRLDATQESVLGVIEDNLKEITSPIIRTLQTFGLTPTEIEIVSLIKTGKTAKQAAELLGISPRTLEGHRYNIRKKLGLDQKKLNLRSYLLSLK